MQIKNIIQVWLRNWLHVRRINPITHDRLKSSNRRILALERKIREKENTRQRLSLTSPFLTKRYSSLGQRIVGVIAETSDGGAAAFTCVHNAYRVTSSRIRTVTTCTRVTISRIKGNLVAPLSLSPSLVHSLTATSGILIEAAREKWIAGGGTRYPRGRGTVTIAL